MEVSDHYKSVQGISRGEYKEKGSKFIGLSYPVQSEEEVRNILTDLKKEYHDARHYCFAYVIGTENVVVRSSDDGEPSNSAGKPILTQIEIRELRNILVVVIRYFGGTLLGVGGLINAYKTAASEALENAKIITQVIKQRYSLIFHYPQMNSVMSLVKEPGINVVSKNLDNRCTLIIDIPFTQVEAFLNKCNRIDNLEVTKI